MTEPSIVTDGGINPPPLTGSLWHTIRTGPTTDGAWQPLDELNVVIPIAGPAAAVAGACDQAAGEAQYIYTTGGGTSLWHTIRYYGGGWQQPGLVNNQIHIPGPVAAVAGAGDGVPLRGPSTCSPPTTGGCGTPSGKPTARGRRRAR